MTLTPKIQKAINLAARLHREHTRIGLNLPYIVHPYSVACLVSEYDDNEHLICAALLHDVLEDVEGYNFKELRRDFGDKVAKLVKEVTEDRTDLEESWTLRDSWKKRKAVYLKSLRSASKEALLICAADTTHNLQSLKETYLLNNKKAIKNFQASVEDKVVFYGKVAAVISKRLKSGIVLRLNAAYKEMHDILAEGH
ncbi:MAG: spoT [Parcubacteria group bacterium Gr01-1014_73]|nr:MAG: spoT [Parcubacteria group bacterium Gr01-1014_73]